MGLEVWKNGVALITGGSSGIGLAIARALGKVGIRVSICGRDPRKLHQAEADLKQQGIPVFAHPCDVSRRDQVEQWVRRSVETFGQVDILVNNAGVALWAPVEAITDEHWETQMAINLKGTLYCVQAALPHLKARPRGYVINISSICGKVGFAASAAYSASKFGVMALSDSLREEMIPHRVKVTAICPGYVATPLVADAPVPQEEMIRPEDIAETVLYLLRLSDWAVVKEIVITRPVED